MQAEDAKQNKSESNRDEKRRLEREQRELKRKEERQRFREESDRKRQAKKSTVSGSVPRWTLIISIKHFFPKKLTSEFYSKQ